MSRFKKVSIDGNSTYPSGKIKCGQGGDWTLFCNDSPNFDSGTLTVNFYHKDGDQLSLGGATDLVFTADFSAKTMTIPAEVEVDFTMSGAGGSLDLDVFLGPAGGK